MEGIVNAIVPQADVEGYVREINRLWSEARDKFLAIGEYLVQAKETLPHGEYEKMIESRLPFKPGGRAPYQDRGGSRPPRAAPA